MKKNRETIIGNSTEIPILIKETKIKPNKSTAVKLSFHKEVEIHIIESGSGFYFIQNRKYFFDKDTLIIIYPDQQHFQYLYPSCVLEKTSIYFKPAILKKFNFRINSIPHSLDLSGREKTKIRLLLDLIKSEINHKEKLYSEIAEKSLNLLLLIFMRCKYRNKNIISKKNPLVDEIIKYLNENYYKKICISEIARKFYKSESYISHVFKDYTGLSIKKYLIQKRILEAKKIIENQSDLKVTKAGEKVGFTSFALFNRSFKKITGMTPLMYKILIEKK